MRLAFVLSEMWIGIRRNLTLTFAVVLTAAISLLGVGGGLLIREQIAAAKDFWYDKVEVSVYLCNADDTALTCAAGAVTQDQRERVEADLKALPEVETVFYESKQQAYENFKRQFKDSAIVENTDPESLPESFRVKLRDPEQFEVVAQAVSGRPGVQSVTDQRRLLDRFFSVLSALRWFVLVIASALGAAAALQIYNAIRVAAFNRRREIGIMRLVGASNLYIQLPFLLEGALTGLLGGLLAAAGVVALKEVVVDRYLAPNVPFIPWIGWNEVMKIAPVLVLLGVLIAIAASFLTLRRYLRV